MEHIEPKSDQINRRRKGQTLAEFAITLPLLLLIIFGVIEFARAFQAWVTLQNAARTAARYATTGNIDEARFDGGDPNIDEAASSLDVVIPCSTSLGKGTLNPAYSPVPGADEYDVQIYESGAESFYATWYDGEECFPSAETEEKRRDILRVASIWDEARRGAAGLALEVNPITADQNSVKTTMYDVWKNPQSRSDQPSWFNVMMCSTRGKTDKLSGTLDPDIDTRFVTVLNPEDDPTGGKYPAPYCMLNEIPASTAATENSGTRWLDPGGPGDRVTVVVTFNHPLITPLGFAPYIQIQARRAAVNESFRVSRAVGSIQGSSPLGGSFPTSTPPPTDTEAPTLPASLTPSRTPIPPTATFTPVLPFSCDLLEVKNVSFFANRFFVEFENNNAQGSELQRVILDWNTLSDYPQMFLNIMALNSEVHWLGEDHAPVTDTINASDAGAEVGWIAVANRQVPGLVTTIWEGAFNNGPGNLASYLTMWDFGGSVFYFSNPSGGADCQKQLTLPPVPVPTTPNPSAPTNTATFTPNCASSQLSVRFDGFDTFGVVRLSVINNRPVVGPFTGFTIVWIKRSPAMTLAKVTVGGTNPDDSASVRVWQGAAPSLVDTNPNTVSTNAADGTWLTNYTFPPMSVTPLYMDFDGTSSTLASAFGVAASDFNGTNFIIGCGTPGGAGGGGGGSSGPIFLANVPTPVPTNTQRPSPTTGPTYTPSITRTPAPATRTFTPAPPTKTRTPAPATATTPPPTATDPSTGGTGGSG